MSGEISTQGAHDVSVMQALKNSLYPGAKDESVVMVLAYCQAAGLDPMTKPVHIVPMSVKNAVSGQYEWRDVVMPGIELYRTKASRTQAHGGTSEPEFGPTVERTFTGKDKNGKTLPPLTLSFPEWCRVTVKRLVSGEVVEFTAKEFWLENYATGGGRDTEIPNSMWSKRPFGQLAKCAESQALRKGFPEVGAQPTADEMAGKTIEAEGYLIEAPPVGKPLVEAPQSKSGRAATEQGGTTKHPDQEPAAQQQDGGGPTLDEFKKEAEMFKGDKGALESWWADREPIAFDTLGEKKAKMLVAYVESLLKAADEKP